MSQTKKVKRLLMIVQPIINSSDCETIREIELINISINDIIKIGIVPVIEDGFIDELFYGQYVLNLKQLKQLEQFFSEEFEHEFDKYMYILSVEQVNRK